MTQSNGRKKSNFPASNSISSSDTLDFVSSGVNYKITYNNFLSGLGVTGTIVQDGNVLGTPVLDTQGTVNNIRNLEDGSGITASVSAENGITLDHNFVNGDGGVDVVKDITLTQPIIRNLQAGSGMAVTVDDDTDSIVLTATGATVATDTVLVSSEADLPTPVAGVITLSSGGPTDYLFLQDVTTSNRFVIADKCSIRSASPSVVKLEYTGSGTMFTAAEPTLKFNSIALSCPNGTFIDASAAAPTGIVQMIECNLVEVDTIGTINNTFITRFHAVAYEDIKTDGFTFTGSHSNLLLDTSVIFLNGGTFLDLGTATFNSVTLDKQIVETSAGGTTFLSGAASSANINSGGLGVVTNTRINGSATPLSGVTSSDDLWYFNLNDDIADTRPDALLSMTTNATNTVISVATTPVLVAGTWTVERTSQTAGTTAGRVTYNADKTAVLPMTASVSVEPASGSNKTLSIYIAKNGSAISNSKRSVVVSSGSPKSITIPWQDSIASGDYYELFVANDTDTNDILVSNAIFRVN